VAFAYPGVLVKGNRQESEVNYCPEQAPDDLIKKKKGSFSSLGRLKNCPFFWIEIN